MGKSYIKVWSTSLINVSNVTGTSHTPIGLRKCSTRPYFVLHAIFVRSANLAKSWGRSDLKPISKILFHSHYSPKSPKSLKLEHRVFRNLVVGLLVSHISQIIFFLSNEVRSLQWLCSADFRFPKQVISIFLTVLHFAVNFWRSLLRIGFDSFSTIATCSTKLFIGKRSGGGDMSTDSNTLKSISNRRTAFSFSVSCFVGSSIIAPKCWKVDEDCPVNIRRNVLTISSVASTKKNVFQSSLQV